MERRINLDMVRESNEILLSENKRMEKELEFLKDTTIKLYSEVLELRCILVKHELIHEINIEKSFIQNYLSK
ncbi:hypothetical protein [Cetobacterium sp.]|uniref:hypothetical protein n=1 Tax=Cetobacterium sp. TaxID=2071632 RepID=UPI003F30B9E4